MTLMDWPHICLLFDGMRTTLVSIFCFIALGSMSCSRWDSRHEQESARQAGREAYRASRELKRDAKHAATDLQHAGKEFREGWENARREDKTAREK